METVTKIKNQIPIDVPIIQILHSHETGYYTLNRLAKQPIVLIKYKNKFLVGDGNHRLDAARLKQQDSIKAYILTSKNIQNIVAHKNAHVAGWLQDLIKGRTSFKETKEIIVDSTREYYESLGFKWEELFNDSV